MKVVLSQLTCLYQLPHVIGVSVMSVIRLLSACQSGAGLLWQHSGKPTRLAGIIVPLPHGNVFCRAVRERLGLCHRHRGRGRRHGEGRGRSRPPPRLSGRGGRRWEHDVKQYARARRSSQSQVVWCQGGVRAVKLAKGGRGGRRWAVGGKVWFIRRQVDGNKQG